MNELHPHFADVRTTKMSATCASSSPPSSPSSDPPPLVQTPLPDNYEYDFVDGAPRGLLLRRLPGSTASRPTADRLLRPSLHAGSRRATEERGEAVPHVQERKADNAHGPLPQAPRQPSIRPLSLQREWELRVGRRTREPPGPRPALREEAVGVALTAALRD